MRDKLERHLAVLGREGVATWFDDDMLAGDHLDREIGRALRQAHVFVALVSSDYAHRSWPRMHRGDLHLFGHSHGILPAILGSLDVGVDCWGWTPVTLPQIQARLAELFPAAAGSP